MNMIIPLRTVARPAARIATLSLVLLLSLQNLQAADTGMERLQAFLAGSDSFAADFEQTLYDAESEPLQNSRGTLKLKRPGRFVWDYVEPRGQRLIADGENLWMLDEELEQVTVNPLRASVSGSPLSILMDSAPLEQAFELESLGESGGIDWISLTPKSSEADFEEVFLGLDASGLVAMELRDNLGQATQIRFTNFDDTVHFDDAVFEFRLPEGFDLIGEVESEEES